MSFQFRMKTILGSRIDATEFDTRSAHRKRTDDDVRLQVHVCVNGHSRAPYAGFMEENPYSFRIFTQKNESVPSWTNEKKPG